MGAPGACNVHASHTWLVQWVAVDISVGISVADVCWRINVADTWVAQGRQGTVHEWAL